MAREIDLISRPEQLPVRKFQDLHRLQAWPAETRAEKAIEIVYDITPEELNTSSVEVLNQLSASILQALDKPLKPRPIKEIHVNGRRYHIELNFEKHLPLASSLAFGKYRPQSLDDTIEILHCMVARMVRPMKKNFFGQWIVKEHRLKDYDLYQEDMLDASLIDVYSAFILPLAVNIEALKLIVGKDKSKFIKGLIDTGHTVEGAEEVFKNFSASRFEDLYK